MSWHEIDDIFTTTIARRVASGAEEDWAAPQLLALVRELSPELQREWRRYLLAPVTTRDTFRYKYALVVLCGLAATAELGELLTQLDSTQVRDTWHDEIATIMIEGGPAEVRLGASR